MTTTAKTAQPNDLLTPDEAAAFLKLSKSWLAKARLTGNGPLIPSWAVASATALRSCSSGSR